MTRNTTLILLTWNALNYIEITLDSLFSSNEEFWLIILDNGSNQNVLEYLYGVQRQFNNVLLIPEKTNIGVTKGRRKAARYVETKYLGTIDSDLCFPKSWLTDLELKLSNDLVGQVGPLKVSVNYLHPYHGEKSLRQVWNDCKSNQTDAQKQLTMFTDMKDLDTFARDLAMANPGMICDVEIPTRSISGCAMLTHTALFNDLRLNDGVYSQDKYGLEDIDYSWSLFFNGYRVLKSDQVYVHHFEHASVYNNHVDIRRASYRNCIYFAQKWEKQLVKWISAQLHNGASIASIANNELMRIILSYPHSELPSKLIQLFR